MAGLLHYLIVLGLGIQTGTIVFFSFVLTPVLFAYLPRDEAARAVRLAFPAYYLTGSAALLLSLTGTLATGGSWRLALALTAALGLELYAGLALLPRLSRLRATLLDPEAPDKDDPSQTEWKRLHGISVKMNLGALLLGLCALWMATA